MIILTQHEYARLYAVLVNCPHCGAKRGEFCFGNNGREWQKAWHGYRAREMDEFRKAHPDVYRRTREMIIGDRLEEDTACGTF